MKTERVIEVMEFGGTPVARHRKGGIYLLRYRGKMQIGGEWVDCVMYQDLLGRWFCRAITDFKKFKYQYLQR